MKRNPQVVYRLRNVSLLTIRGTDTDPKNFGHNDHGLIKKLLAFMKRKHIFPLQIFYTGPESYSAFFEPEDAQIIRLWLRKQKAEKAR